MATPEELVTKLAGMLQQQHDRMDEERKDAIRREEKMQALLEAALQRPAEHQPQQAGKIPNNATPAPMLMHNASLREFVTWKQKFQDYILLTGVDKASNEQQKAVLRSLLDDEWFRIITFALSIKMEEATTTTDTIITQMQEHLRSQRNIVLDRKEFYLRNQQPDEKFDDYYVSLQEIAGFCNFCNECITDQYRDRIVTGINSEETVKTLLSEKDLTLEKAVSICRANENAQNDSENLQSTASGINRIAKYKKQSYNQQYKKPVQPWNKKGNEYRYSKSQPVNQNENTSRYGSSQSWRDEKWKDREEKLCKFCGRRWHDHISQCQARDQNCAKCGKLGHFARVCISTVEESEEESDENGDVWRITVAGVNEKSFKRKTPKTSITARYEGKEVELKTTPDSGAEVSVIGIEDALKLGANVDNLKPYKHRLFAADRKQLTSLGILPVQLQLGEISIEVNLVVVIEVKGFLLSWYHAIDLKILPECFPNQISKVSQKERKQQPEGPPICSDRNPSSKVREQHAKQLKATFSSVFEVGDELKTMHGKPMRILLTEDATPFALTAARSIPCAWKDKIKSQLEEMVQKNIIKEVTEPTSWCHPMVPTPKKDSNEVRVCVDLTRLNKFVRRGAHPVLTSNEAVSSIKKGSRYFSTMDAKFGYWQVLIAEEDQELTTFITPWGRYKFLRAPMGLSISGDEYNRRGDEALRTATNTVKIVDDILVSDDDYQQHLNHVWHVLSKCKEQRITLNPKKFQFAQDEVNYCGYHISSEGFSPDAEKLSAIVNFPTPTNISELRSFLGVANQLSQFSSEVSSLAEPLRHLLKKENEWTWLEAHEKSFEEVKKALLNPPILAYYDPRLPVVVQTDAAKLKGLGYACMQKHDKVWKLVDCGSRFLTETESRYATIELEMLAIVWSIKKCRRMLAGREHFEVLTDHKPLIPIVNSKGISDIENPRLQRLKENLVPYKFTLSWVKGSDHTIPDALSRSPTEKATQEDEIAEQELEEHIHAVVTTNIMAVNEEREGQYQDSLLEEVFRHSEDDEEYKLLKKTIIEGFPEDIKELPESIRPYAKVKDLLCIDQGLIVCGQRLLIPRKLRKDILFRLHSSHQGIERTRRRARQSVYWPDISNDVQNVVKSCQECQKLLPKLQKEPIEMVEEPSRAFQSVSADYFDHAGKPYLIYTDRLSGWPMVKMFHNGATARKLITTLRKFFAATGIPEILRSDNGPQFTASEIRSFLEQWGVQIKTSSPYYPQSNGHAESSVKSVKHLIIKCTKNGNLDTDKFAMGLLELRNSPREDGQSPAQVVFGHPIRSVVPVHRRAYEAEWQKSKVQCEEKRGEIRRRTEDRYNLASKSLPEFEVGSHVNVQDYHTGRWQTTGTIVEVGKNRQYLVKKNTGALIWRNRRFIRRHHPLILPSHSTEIARPRPPTDSPVQQPTSPPIQQPIREETRRRPDSLPKLDFQLVPSNSPVYNPPLSVPKRGKNNNFAKVPTMPSVESAPRRRQAPARLMIDPKEKTYKQQ